jgi:hypothetical protein
MNALSQNRLANARIDSQATGFAANMIGGIGQTIFGAQKGGYLRDEDDDDVEFDEDRMEGLQHGDYVNTPADATYANQPPMDYLEAPQYTMSAGSPRMEDFGLTEEELIGMMPGVAGAARGVRKIYNIHKAVDKGKGGLLSQWDKDMLKGYITDFLRKKKISKSIRDNRSPSTKAYEQSRGNPIADKVASRRDHLRESRRPTKAGEQTDLGFQSGDYVENRTLKDMVDPYLPRKENMLPYLEFLTGASAETEDYKPGALDAALAIPVVGGIGRGVFKGLRRALKPKASKYFDDGIEYYQEHGKVRNKLDPDHMERIRQRAGSTDDMWGAEGKYPVGSGPQNAGAIFGEVAETGERFRVSPTGKKIPAHPFAGEGMQEGGLLSSAYINTQNGPVRIASRHGGQIYE